MTENTVLWTPRSNQEKTACSKWSSWRTNGGRTWGPGRLKGTMCIFIWPVDAPNEGRWIDVHQVTFEG